MQPESNEKKWGDDSTGKRENGERHKSYRIFYNISGKV
jgi:hypothetical protein